MPAGIHLAVVDPGVGSAQRRAVALRCARAGVAQHMLVGPDNGLLWLAAQHLGGVAEAVDISDSPLCLEPVHASFHGRDIFAPVAAHLALRELRLSQVGTGLDPATLETLELPRARATRDGLFAHALIADAYGNVMLDAEPAQLEQSGLRHGHEVTVNGRRALYARTFSDVDPGELVLYPDSYGAPSLAVNRGSALAALDLRIDDDVRITYGAP
jgi:S-adenosylmethionine hydrolase